MSNGPNVFLVSCINKNKQTGEDEHIQVSISFYVSAIVKAARAHSSYQPSQRRAGPNQPYPCDRCRTSDVSVKSYQKVMAWSRAVEMIMLSGDLANASLHDFTNQTCRDYDFSEWNREDNFIALCYDCAPNYQRRNILRSQIDLSKRFGIIYSGVWIDKFRMDSYKKKRRWSNIEEYTEHYLQKQQASLEDELTKIK